MARKTVDVSRVRDMANHYATVPGSTPEARLAVHYFVGSLLHESGQYKGFKYAEQKWNDETDSMDLGDESRRVFY